MTVCERACVRPTLRGRRHFHKAECLPILSLFNQASASVCARMGRGLRLGREVGQQPGRNGGGPTVWAGYEPARAGLSQLARAEQWDDCPESVRPSCIPSLHTRKGWVGGVIELPSSMTLSDRTRKLGGGRQSPLMAVCSSQSAAPPPAHSRR